MQQSGLPRRKRNRRGAKATKKNELVDIDQQLKTVVRNEVPNPPKIAAPLVVSVRRRFQMAAATAGTGELIYGAYLLDMLKVGVNSTSAYRLVQSLKIKRIEMWSQISVASGSTTNVSIPVAVCWSGSNWSPSYEMIDSSIGEQSSHLVTSPPRGSAASEWIISGGQFDSGNSSLTELFRLYGTEGTIVDVWFDLVFRADNTSATICTFLTTGYVAGQLYYGNLDATTANIVPIGSLNVL